MGGSERGVGRRMGDGVGEEWVIGWGRGEVGKVERGKNMEEAIWWRDGMGKGEEMGWRSGGRDLEGGEIELEWNSLVICIIYFCSCPSG